MLLAAAAYADPAVQLIGTSGIAGDGNLSVAIGQSGGWGFRISNDNATLWIGANISDFCPSSVSAPPCDTTTWQLASIDPFGPYTDLFGTNFVTIAPGDTLTETFDPGNSGAGSISLTGRNDINVGDTQSGHLAFVYDFYDADPNASGNQQGGDHFMYADASVTAIANVPEPSAAQLGLLGLAVAFLGRRLRLCVLPR